MASCFLLETFTTICQTFRFACLKPFHNVPLFRTTMKFNARGGVSILEVFIFFPSFFIAIWICKRHGFGRSSGWIFTLILCLIRIIGACCQLATYHDQSQGLLETTIILDSVGISPLLLGTLGLLSRRYANSPFSFQNFNS